MPLSRSQLELLTADRNRLDRNLIPTRKDVLQALKEKEKSYVQGKNKFADVSSDLADEMIEIVNNSFKAEIASHRWHIVARIRNLYDKNRWVKHSDRMKTKRELDQELPQVFPIVMRHKVPNNYLPLFDDQFGERRMRFDKFWPDLEAAPE